MQMKIAQETLGHASSTFTRDDFTSLQILHPRPRRRLAGLGHRLHADEG